MSVPVLLEDTNACCLHPSKVQVLNSLQRRRDIGSSRRVSSGKNPTELSVGSHFPYKGRGS